MAALSRSSRRTFDIWPGFVDALAALLILIIFVLMVFVVAHFYLSTALSGQDQALARLNQRIGELAEMLSLEEQSNEDLRLSMAEIAAELQASGAEREELSANVGDLRASVSASLSRAAKIEQALAAERRALAASRSRADRMEEALAEARSRAGEAERDLSAAGERASRAEKKSSAERATSRAAQLRLELLNRQVAALRQQLRAVQGALESSEAKVVTGNLRIKNLGKRLNVALAVRVQELKRYRSEFFGRLREILGDRADIRVEGDRFVFQSELLFTTASAELEFTGQKQIAALAKTLKELSRKIPSDIDWILRVDGHTDRRPISTPEFPSNWELSTARAHAVVKFLVSQGIPPNRLAATGFGEFQPIDLGVDEAALRRNRRIELKLTQR